MTADRGTPPAVEFSRPVVLDAVPEDGFAVSYEADEAERAAVARRLGVQAVSRLALSGMLRRQGYSDLYRLTGALAADLVQTCVVSLEPLETRVEAAVRREFLPAEPDQDAAAEAEIDAEAPDPPDPAPHGVADLGEVAVEELALALDPYPRKPGAELPDHDRPSGPEEGEGPFSVLRRLKH